MNYVSARLANSSQMTKRGGAEGQAMHDTRAKAPSYLQHERGECGYWLGNDILQPNAMDIIRLDPPTPAEIKAHLAKLSAQQIANYEQKERGPKKQKQKLQKNAQLYLSGIVTFSPEQMGKVLEDEDLNSKLLNKCAEYIRTLCDRLNTTPAWVAIHHDETTLHLQYGLCNIGRDCKAVQRRINKSKAPDRLMTPQELQDHAAEIFAPLGFTRGKAGSTVKHQTVRESHRIECLKMATKQNQIQQDINSLNYTIEQLKQEAEALRETIRQMRRSREELKKQTKTEREAQTKAQQEARQKMKELKAQIEKLQQEKNKHEEEKEQRLNIAMHMIKATGLRLAQLRRSVIYSNKWRMSPQTYNLTTEQGRRDLRDTLAQSVYQSSWHVNNAELSPIYCLDDITPEQLRHIRADGIRPNAVVETSPGNFQVWVKFGTAYRWPKAPLLPEQWRRISQYLINRYNADPAPANYSHPFRLPGFPRADNPDYIAKLVSTDEAPNGFDIIEDKVADDSPRYDSDRDSVADFRTKQGHNIKINENEDVPDWFVTKWQARREEIANQLSDRTPSEWDFATTRELIKRSHTPKTKLQTAQYCWLMLKIEAMERHKGHDYADRTLNAVISDMEEFER